MGQPSQMVGMNLAIRVDAVPVACHPPIAGKGRDAVGVYDACRGYQPYDPVALEFVDHVGVLEIIIQVVYFQGISLKVVELAKVAIQVFLGEHSGRVVHVAVLALLPADAHEAHGVATEYGLFGRLRAPDRKPLPCGRGGLTVDGRKVRLFQKTNYPWDDRIAIKVTTSDQQEFELCCRIPGWCTDWSASINGETIDPSMVDNGYIRICREWEGNSTSR